MSTLAISPLHRNLDQAKVSTQETQELPDSQHVAAAPGHNGELAFRRHVIAVYNGYMGATVLIASFYMALVWLYLKFQ